jgi:hypothetical protein
MDTIQHDTPLEKAPTLDSDLSTFQEDLRHASDIVVRLHERLERTRIGSNITVMRHLANRIDQLPDFVRLAPVPLSVALAGGDSRGRHDTAIKGCPPPLFST